MAYDKKHVQRVAAELEAMGYKLYDERVAVVRDKTLDQTESGLWIPEEAREKQIAGTVVMVGEAVTSGIAVLDRVTFTKYNPVLMELKLLDGSIALEVMHAMDIYIGWRDLDAPGAELPRPSLGGGSRAGEMPEPHVPGIRTQPQTEGGIGVESTSRVWDRASATKRQGG